MLLSFCESMCVCVCVCVFCVVKVDDVGCMCMEMSFKQMRMKRERKGDDRGTERMYSGRSPDGGEEGEGGGWVVTILSGSL